MLVKPVWPDEALAKSMLEDVRVVEERANWNSSAADLCCHVRALLQRVRDLEAVLRSQEAEKKGQPT